MSDSLVVVIEEIAKNIETIKNGIIVVCACLSSITIAVWFRFWRD